MRHDHVVLGVDGCLDVVADDTGSLGLRHHRARVGVGQRALLVRFVLQLPLDAIEVAHLLAQLLDLVLQPLGLRLDLQRLGSVCRL